MNKPIIFLPEALRESRSAKAWYAERNPYVAEDFEKELLRAVEQVKNSPERWPRYRRGTRRYVFPRFPFSLIYRIKEDEITVYAVAHAKRRPEYWEKR